MSVKIHKRGAVEVYEITGRDVEMLSEEEIEALEEPQYDEEALREILAIKSGSGSPG